jgi:hypothetical protein
MALVTSSHLVGQSVCLWIPQSHFRTQKWIKLFMSSVDYCRYFPTAGIFRQIVIQLYCIRFNEHPFRVFRVVNLRTDMSKLAGSFLQLLVAM